MEVRNSTSIYYPIDTFTTNISISKHISLKLLKPTDSISDRTGLKITPTREVWNLSLSNAIPQQHVKVHTPHAQVHTSFWVIPHRGWRFADVSGQVKFAPLFRESPTGATFQALPTKAKS